MKDSGVTKPDIDQQVRQAVNAMLGRKATDLKILRISDVTPIADYFLICSGTNQRQVQAIVDAINEALRPHKIRPLGVEGYRLAEWVLMDYGDFVVHIFDDERRAFYGLDGLWADTADVTRDFCG